MTVKNRAKEMMRFSRPHTIIGTSLSVTVLFLLAYLNSDRLVLNIPVLLYALIACLGANIFIVGLNQITDIDIDKINKPFLPLASGAYTLHTAKIIVGLSVLIALGIALTSGVYLFMAVGLSLALGTAYSLPPFRLKRFHFWAAFCIIAVRGVIVNILLFLHFQVQIEGEVYLPGVIILLTAAMFGYSIVIAWFKDIPDMAGDAKFKIKTMSIRLGPDRVFRIGNYILISTLMTLALISFFLTLNLHPLVMAITHGLMLVALFIKIKNTNPANLQEIRKFYLFVWSLFFAEYISFALASGLSNI